MPEIISRKEAKARGLKRYFTGKACKWGHIAFRATVNATCLKCNAIGIAAYKKKNRPLFNALASARYRKDIERSRASARANSKRFYWKNRDEIRSKPRNREAARAYYSRNRAKCNAASIKWMQENPERVREVKKQYRAKHAEQRRQKWRDYNRKNKEKMNARRREKYHEKIEESRLYARKNYYLGPSNPKGELGCLRRSRVQLRNVKRLLKNLRHGLRPSPSSAFMTPTDSPK